VSFQTAAAAGLMTTRKASLFYWPWLVGTDKRLPPMDIFLGGYYTAVHAGDYDVRSSATELFNALNVPDIDYNSKPLDKTQLVFVCHSTGGIVVRYMLCRQWQHFASKRIGLVLIASPSSGAEWAERLRWIVDFYKNSIGAQLRSDSFILAELEDDFKNVVYNKQI
jgi:hypothetical protein